MNKTVFLSILVAMSGVACSKDNLPTYIQLGDLRVLALIADKPEAPVGTLVTITPVVSDVNGGGRALTFTAEACNDPGVGVGANPTCVGSDTRVVLVGPTAAAVTGIAAPDFTGAATSTIAVTLPASVFTNASAIQQAIGVPYLFVYKLIAADGATVTAFKRVLVSVKPALGAVANQNPSITAIMSGGSAYTMLGTDKVFLSPLFGANSAETFVAIQGDGSTVQQTEQLITTWFISDGSVDSFRTLSTDAVGFVPPTSPPPNGRHTVILPVVRDGRGGEAFFKQAL
ncbi:MAG: hypothetical protein HY074_12750 [Deltaproteobacteria bacterium]|nr:hypothetical protein [Deltaproteobacteria bacterium]